MTLVGARINEKQTMFNQEKKLLLNVSNQQESYWMPEQRSLNFSILVRYALHFWQKDRMRVEWFLMRAKTFWAHAPRVFCRIRTCDISSIYIVSRVCIRHGFSVWYMRKVPISMSWAETSLLYHALSSHVLFNRNSYFQFLHGYWIDYKNVSVGPVTRRNFMDAIKTISLFSKQWFLF